MTTEPTYLRRRTFAIISHPDAGKTTLTEKLLLFGGAIQLAGAVKARGEQRRKAHAPKMTIASPYTNRAHFSSHLRF